MLHTCLFFLVSVACFASSTNAANILLLPFLNMSHFMEIDGVGRPLMARGHNVYVLLDENTALPKEAPYKLITHRNVKSDTYSFHDAEYQRKVIGSSQSGLSLTLVFEMTKAMCISLYSDLELFPKLRSLNLDLVILDNGPVPCFHLVPHILDIPFVTVSSWFFSWYARVPILPSVVQPNAGLDVFGVSMCEETPSQLSIIRRFCRLLGLALPELYFSTVPEDFLRKYVDFPSIAAIRENASLTLMNWNYLLSSAYPKLPHVEYVGGLTTKPAKPLEDSLDKWMSLAPNVVVVSFGSMMVYLPQPVARKLFDAFGRLSKYRFLMRFKGEDSKAYDVPDNVRVMDWLPQNDALGHKNTRAFVTHSGNNGQQEALYHGVPMLCFYVQGDQKSNAKRVADRGYGKMLNLYNFTVDNLIADLTELVDTDTYSSRIKLASAVFHSEKHPSERAADAVEHVLKYGAEHLRPKEAYNLSFWQFYMLDVLVVLYSIAFFALLAVIRVCKCLVKRILFSRKSDGIKAKVD